MRPARKPLPSNLTLDQQRELLLRPERNTTGHVPLEEASRNPFQPHATGWSRVNAWWLAEASWLAYWQDESRLRAVFDTAGLTCDAIANEGAECFLAAGAEFAILAFRGSQPDDWRDIFDDACYAPVRWDVGHVHAGFARRLDNLRAPLESALGRLPPGRRVWFTGHSLGGAIASLAAYRYREIAAGACTFGSPRVGNGVFAGLFGEAIDERSVRYANDHDIVSRVPPEPFALPHGLFTHVDHLRWINKNGQVGTTPPTLPDFVHDVFGRPNVMLDIIRLHETGAQLSIPDALSDHTPLYYALHCWNDYADHDFQLPASRSQLTGS